MSLKSDCRICFNKNLHTVLNLGEQPLANDYHLNTTTTTTAVYPLCLMWCQNCTHLQLSHVIDKNLLYKHYQYVSGTSTTMYKYFDWIADKITLECKKGKKILDIACNDGSQLNHFRTKGWDTYGIDPAENINCLNNQHTIYKDFFNFEFSTRLKEKFDVILAQNVVAHVDDVHDFIRGCKHILNDDGVLYIQTSQCNMIKNNEFDTIYHEHHSFFNINSMKTLIESQGLHLARVERTFIHGTSYLFTIYKHEPSLEQQNVLELELQAEKYLSLLETYDTYTKNVDIVCKNLIERVSELKDDGYTVIGYGAAAKGNTLLNYCNLELDCIIDDADIKWGLYTPGMNIHIVPPSHLTQFDKNCKLVIIPLAWNFFDEIVEKVENVCPNAFFLRYFPHIEMIYPMTVSDKTPTITVITHFYNEEYLLPFWLKHHKDIFDHGILINYNSTDSSIDIIKSIVPHWEIVDSRNEYFDALECDNEVMDIETRVKGWKITLNITEFIMSVNNLHKLVHKYGRKDYNALSIRSLQMIESQEHETSVINKDESLVTQRTYGTKDYTRKTRTLHRDIHGNYDFGRHNTRVYPFIEMPISSVVILWYGYSPMTSELLNRKLQIKDKMSLKDKTNGTMGVEHLRNKDQLLMYWNTSQNMIFDFKMDAELCQYYLLLK